MIFSSKKRARPNAWKELQKELDEREQLEEENSTKFDAMAKLKSRTAMEEELDPEKTHAYMDLMIGRAMGKDPQLIRGRLIFELFDDIMPRTIEQFIRMLEARSEPMYTGSVISKIWPGDKCHAGDRTSNVEGSSTGRETVFSRVDQEANWSVPHLNPGILSLADSKSSKFNITFRNCEELDGWHAVFGKTVYGFDVLKAISEQGNDNGEPKVCRALRETAPCTEPSVPPARQLPVVVTGGGAIPRGTHPREFLKAIERPKEIKDEDRKKVMRYSSVYRHTGLIGH